MTEHHHHHHLLFTIIIITTLVFSPSILPALPSLTLPPSPHCTAEEQEAADTDSSRMKLLFSFFFF